MAVINNNEFSPERMMPKAFTPLQVGSPTKYDPTGRDFLFNDVPYKTRMGRLKPLSWLGESYSPEMSKAGYVRNSLKSTLEG